MGQGLPESLRNLPAVTDGAFEGLESALGYSFRSGPLLRTALTLGSWLNENRGSGWAHNACLEFLGDAVLDLVAAHALWLQFPEVGEGTLTRLRATLVCEAGLSGVAGEIDLGDYLFVGRGDDERGARVRPTSLADGLEAVFGAVFLDAQTSGGDATAACAAVFAQLFATRIAALSPRDGLDPKSQLQQLIQGRFRVTPTYEVVEEAGTDGLGLWRARVMAQLYPDRPPIELGRGEGRSLREAQRAAAGAGLRSDALL